MSQLNARPTIIRGHQRPKHDRVTTPLNQAELRNDGCPLAGPRPTGRAGAMLWDFHHDFLTSPVSPYNLED